MVTEEMVGFLTRKKRKKHGMDKINEKINWAEQILTCKKTQTDKQEEGYKKFISKFQFTIFYIQCTK